MTIHKTSLLPVIESWGTWAAVFTKTEFWKPAIAEICRRASIPLDSIQAGYPGTNAVFIVNQRFVVKIYAPFCHDDFYLERELLAVLGKNDLIPIPRLHAKGILEDRMPWPYIVMTYIPGQSIRDVRDKMPLENKLEIAAQMGSVVHTLHRTPLSSLKNLDCSRNGWRRYVQLQLKNTSKKLRRKHVLPEYVVQTIPSFVNNELEKHHEIHDDRLSLVHGDLTDDHWLLHYAKDQWSISALIDFADAKISPSTYEWPALWFSALGRDNECFNTFIHSYDPDISIDNEFYNLAMAYTFLHEFGAEILEDELSNSDINDITSIDDLTALLWAQAF